MYVSVLRDATRAIKRGLIGVSAASVLLLSQSPPPAYAATVAKAAAPSLMQAEAKKLLPPLEQRVPSNPLVVKPAERIGKYGGSMRSFISGAGDESWLRTFVGYDYLMRWTPDVSTIIPNIAASLSSSDDSRIHTFKLREGMKWSDGQPFTAQDILFWWEDVAQNEKLPADFKPRAVQGAGKLKVEAIDDYTVRFTFEKPHGLFPQMLATMDGEYITRFPKHYLKQFLPKYNPDADKLAKQRNFPDSAAMFEQMSNVWLNPDRPTLFAWKVVQPLSDTRRVILERNPYYWKIDPEGNQLPYLDRVTFEVVGDKEVMLLKTLSGEVDYLPRYINTFPNRAVLVDNEKAGNYRLIEYPRSDHNYMVISFNQTSENPTLRQLFRNRDFRVGMSYAINRQDIIDIVYVSQGEPYQAAPRPESDLFNEKLAKQYTEFDQAKANEYLDKAGLTKRNAQGIRLLPNGEPATFVMTVREDRQPMVDAMELIARQWREVGIDVKNRVVEKSMQRNLRNTNQHEALVDEGESGLIDAIITPRAWLPIDNSAAWGMKWFDYVRGNGGEEPPENIKRTLALYDKLLATSSIDEQKKIFGQMMDQAAENFVNIGIAAPLAGYGVVSNKLRNVPSRLFGGWAFADTGPSNPEQYFLQD
jgi:peptide/nickel transport system substrate-binding protein